MAKPTVPSWREILPVHPAADALPLLPEDQLRELGEDIKANGLKHPLVMWSESNDDGMGAYPISDETTYLLDGRNRLDSMELVGIPTVERWPEADLRELTPEAQAKYRSEKFRLVWGLKREHLEGRKVGMILGDPTGAYEARPGIDPVAYVISANLRRRHLRPRDLVLHAMAVRSAVSGARTLPLSGGERRDEDGNLRQTRTSGQVSTGGRGHKSDATEIAEQTGVPARTVRRVMAEHKPDAKLARAQRDELAKARSAYLGARREKLRSEAREAAMKAIMTNDEVIQGDIVQELLFYALSTEDLAGRLDELEDRIPVWEERARPLMERIDEIIGSADR